MEKITTLRNPVCTHIKKLGRNKSYREQQGLFLCDGFKLLNDALLNKTEIETILISGEINFIPPPETRVYNVNKSIIDSLSPLKNPQGVLFSCRIKKATECDYSTDVHILLDSVQDPGNVGTIIRNAFAFGIESVILTGGTADIYNPKTIRATMGAIFKQRVCSLNYDEIIGLKNSGVIFAGSVNEADSVDIKQTSLKDIIIILGNEGQGISEELLKLCEKKIRITVSSECESINVASAASIIMWEASR